MDQQIYASFAQRHAIARMIVDSSVEEVLYRLDELSKNPAFQGAVSRRDISSVEDILATASALTQKSSLDLLIITENNGSVIMKAGSPLFETRDVIRIVRQLTNPMHTAGRIVAASGGNTQIGIVGVRRIINKPTGRVMGAVVGGSVLNGNLPFVEMIREKAQVPAVALLHGDQLIASSAPADSEISRTLVKIARELNPCELYFGQGVVGSFQELSIQGSKAPLRICLSDDGAAWNHLSNSFLKKFGILVVVCILVILFNLLFLRRIIEESVDRMMDCFADISTGQKEHCHQPGRIREFNIIGQAAEAMMQSLRIADQNLDESERKFQALFDQTFQFIGLLDLEGRVLETNQASLDTVGVDRDSVKGKYFWETPWWKHDPVEAARVKEAVFQAREGLFVRLEATYMNARNELRHIDFSVKPAIGNNGNVTMLIPEGRDITERKAAQHAMKDLRLLLQNILDSMPSIVAGVDADGKITHWNHEAECQTGIAAREARGRTLEQTLPDFPKLPVSMKEALDTRRIVKNPRVVVLSKAKARFFDCTVFPLMANEVHGAVVRLDEVTDRVQMEQSMVNAEKMASLGGLAAGMAHEINNPLAGMIQNAQVISNRISVNMQRNQEIARDCGTDMESISRYMEQRGIYRMFAAIMESGNRAASIIDHLLVFARDKTTGFQLQNLESLLENALDLASVDFGIKTLMDFKKITILKDFPPDIPLVPCDPGGMQQVFLNLIKNAAQALASTPKTRERGTIHLALRHEEDMVCIEFRDNGPGMAEEVQKRAFEPFFTTRPTGRGTGLGLSVSYFIVTEDHAGDLCLKTCPGKGTAVIVRLPLMGKMTQPMGGAGG